MESKGISPRPGVLLVAPPMMHDPNFRRAVVLLCEHTSEGSFGLILNRTVGVRLSDVIPDLDDGDIPIDNGGPVQTDTLHFIHTCGDIVPGTIPVSSGISWGGEFDFMKLLIETEQISKKDVRFFFGYAGWSPGQLSHEIEQGGWLLASGGEESVFSDDPDSLWKHVLRMMGGEYAVLANFPEDPRLN